MKTTSLSIIVFLFLASCNEKQATTDQSAADQAAIDEETTSQVLKHHWDAFQANDLEETMKDYTEESILITPDQTFNGLSEIRENFVFAFSVFPKDSSTLQLDKTVVSGDVGYIIWKADAPKLNLTFATDTFIIHDGKIVRQTYAGVVAP
jgi:ketosteroid isomerase-like protein